MGVKGLADLVKDAICNPYSQYTNVYIEINGLLHACLWCLDLRCVAHPRAQRGSVCGDGWVGIVRWPSRPWRAPAALHALALPPGDKHCRICSAAASARVAGCFVSAKNVPRQSVHPARALSRRVQNGSDRLNSMQPEASVSGRSSLEGGVLTGPAPKPQP